MEAEKKGPHLGTPFCTWVPGLLLEVTGSWTCEAPTGHGALSPAYPTVERSSYLPVLPFLPTGRGSALIPTHLLPPTFRGFFRAGAAIRLIEPLDGGSEGGQHALYEAQHLRQKAWTCGVSNTSLESILGPRTSAAFRPRVRNPHPASSLPPRLPMY